MKNYMSALEGVKETEERENSLKASQAPAPPARAFQWPFEPGSGSRARAVSGNSLLSGNSLSPEHTPKGEVDDILFEPAKPAPPSEPLHQIGIPGIPFRGDDRAYSDVSAGAAGERFCTESCQTAAEPTEKMPKKMVTPGISSSLAKRRASMNLKPLGE